MHQTAVADPGDEYGHVADMAPCCLPQPVLQAPAQQGPLLRLRLMGHMDARGFADADVLPSGRKTRALLAITALAAPRPALRGRIADTLWSHRPEEQARASLRQEIHRLRAALGTAGEALQITRDHVSFGPSAVWTDVAEAMCADTDRNRSLSLLEGDLLDGLDGVDSGFDAFLAAERERLKDHSRSMAEALLSEQTAPDAEITAAQRLLRIDRSHEGAWRTLMRAYALQGETGMAVQAYERCRGALAGLIDAVPSPETQKLLCEIRGKPATRRPAVPQCAPRPDAGWQPGVVDAGRTSEPCPDASAEDGVAGGGGWEPGPGVSVGIVPMRVIGAGGSVGPDLAAAMSVEIAAALTRFRWISVVSSDSLALQAASPPGDGEIGRIFGIGFLVDGTVQMAGDRARITVRLHDLHGNQVAWARRFDCDTGDLFTLQEEIAAGTVAQIESEIRMAEVRRCARTPSADAYSLVLRAIPLIERMDRGGFMRAGEYLAKAVAIGPDHADPYAWYAYWHTFLASQDWADDRLAAVAIADKLADQAVVLDPCDARALAICGHVRASLLCEPAAGAAMHERALSLNPNLAMGWALSAAACAFLGDTDEAEQRAIRYRRLSPHDPDAFLFDGVSTLIHLLKHDHRSAVDSGRAVCGMNPAFSANFKPYLAALGHLGLAGEAARVRLRLLEIEPDFTVERFLSTTPISLERDFGHYAEGLRLAGVPDGGMQSVAAPAGVLMA